MFTIDADKVKRYTVEALFSLCLIKCLSTSSLPWLLSTTFLGIGAAVAKGNPIAQLRARDEEYKLKMQQLTEQAATLEESQWTLETKLQEVAVEKEALTTKTNDYAEQLRESATQQVQALAMEYEERLAIARDERLLLEDRVSFLLEKIDNLQAPKLPTASDPASLLTAKLCTALQQVGCAVDYERCWYDSGDVIAWITPRKGGIKAVSKHADELQLRLSLTKKPMITIINGVVQVAMTPQAYVSDTNSTPLAEVYDVGMARQHLLQAWTKEAPPRVVGFVEPLIAIQPVGGITRVEHDWILHCHYLGRDERSTIARVYGCTGSKQTGLYRQCKERYDEVIKELNNYDTDY